MREFECSDDSMHAFNMSGIVLDIQKGLYCFPPIKQSHPQVVRLCVLHDAEPASTL